MKMNELVLARRKELGWSQLELAARAGVYQQVVDRVEKGSNSKALRAILDALGLDGDGVVRISPSAPAQNLEIATPRSGYRAAPLLFVEGTIPLYASAEGGKGHLIVSTDEIGRAPRPDILDGAEHAYAILITGTSMKDAYEPGDRALVNPHLGPTAETDCILYSVKDGDATATIKRMVNWTDKEWSLRQFNPARAFKLDRGIWQTHHRVVGNLKRSFGGRVPFGAV